MKDRIINYNLLWEKLRDYAIKVGRLGTRPLLLLYLVLKSPQTSKEDKQLILSTLSYLVLPIDLLDAKKLPIIGWLDEVASAQSPIRRSANTSLRQWKPRQIRFSTDGFQIIHLTN